LFFPPAEVHSQGSNIHLALIPLSYASTSASDLLLIKNSSQGCKAGNKLCNGSGKHFQEDLISKMQPHALCFVIHLGSLLFLSLSTMDQHSAQHWA